MSNARRTALELAWTRTPLVGASAVLLSLAARAQVPMTTQLVASGFNRPLQVAHVPGDASRIFVVEKTGKIRIVQGGSVLPTPFLDLTAVVNSTTIEFGLLALCFDPGYSTNGFFYVNYTAGANGDTNVARYHVSADPNVADASSRQTVLFVAASSPNHRAGWLGFGGDGYLYVAQGDGGPQEDPFNHAQDLALVHGKILRIDVNGDDFPADPDRNYRIPPGNPWAGLPGVAPEIWALGLRNPWRCSFDRATGDLWIGDVGEYEREEVDVVPAGASALNFGWRCMEGTSCSIWGGCTCGSPALTAPVHDYAHAVGRAVTCGYVYRGSAIPGLQGAFVFGDYQSGRLWTLRWNGSSVTELIERTAELDPGALDIAHPSSFGEDAQGELYVCDFFDGEVFRLVPAPDPSRYCFGDGSATACPCGNVGAADSGCPSSINPAGAGLGHSGTPSLSADTLALLGTGLTNSTVTFFQGTTLMNGGNGVVFGDGLRCVGGTIVRLGAALTAAGAAQYPSGSAPPVSVRGLVTVPGSQRTYQVWYRNAAAFCQPETFNLTNGLFVVWAP